MIEKKIFSSIFIIFLLFLGTKANGSTKTFPQDSHYLTLPQIKYTYEDRDHTRKEDFKYLGTLYSVSWLTYYATQPDTFREHGSFEKYRHNLGRLVLDKDEPVWNWMVHPYTGSQVYLFYRANGYSRMDAFKMTFIQSTLFEITTETYTEPASIQDLYQTPVWGSMLGVVFENLSLYLLNEGNVFARVFGHLINPSTLFWFFEGKVQVYPMIKNKNEGQVTAFIQF